MQEGRENVSASVSDIGDGGDVAENTWLAQGEYAAFFEANRRGIQYVDTIKGVYYVSRRHTLRGPIPGGVRVEHTGLAGYPDDNMYTPEGFKRDVRERTGGTHSKRSRRR